MNLHYLLPLALLAAACGNDAPAAETEAPDAAEAELPYKISLAQWSLHKRYLPEGMFGGQALASPYEFPAYAKELGFDGVEYVSVIYQGDFEDGPGRAASIQRVFQRLDSAAAANDIAEVLIMVDAEGELGAMDESERATAVANHKPYIDAAAASGIPTIRLNAGGESLRVDASPRQAHDQTVRSLRELGAYAKTKGGVNLVVENHGGYSSDPVWLRDVMAAVDLDNVGILPDFGNFCRRRVNPTVWEEGCADEVPADSIYAAVGMWMPYAHAVSAKSYDFDADGNETKIDFARMIDTVRAYGYDGYIGVEYEGEDIGEEDGSARTKALLERVGRG